MTHSQEWGLRLSTGAGSVPQARPSGVEPLTRHALTEPAAAPRPAVCLNPDPGQVPEAFRRALAEVPQSGSREIVPQLWREAVLDVGSGVVFGSDGAPWPVSHFYNREPLPDLRISPQRLPGGEWVLLGHNAGWENFFHFMMQGMFSLWLAREVMRLPGRALVVRTRLAWQAELIGLLGLDGDEVLRPPAAAQMRIAGLVALPTLYRPYSQHLSPLLGHFGTVLRARAGVPEDGGGKLYVSRRDSDRRRMVNEARIEVALAARGYRVVRLAGMALRDQIAAFRGADTVVGAHGAGLAHLIHCRPGTRVVELGGTAWFHNSMSILARVMGHDYGYFVSTAPSEGRDRHRQGWTQDEAVLDLL